MENTRILLWLDDLRDPHEQDWINWLAQYSPIEQPYTVVWVKSYEQLVDWVKKNSLPSGFSFDHDLGQDIAIEKVKKGMSKRQARKEKKNAKSGMDVAKWLVEYCLDNNLKMPKFSIQSANPCGRDNIRALLNGFIKHQNNNN